MIEALGYALFYTATLFLVGFLAIFGFVHLYLKWEDFCERRMWGLPVVVAPMFVFVFLGIFGMFFYEIYWVSA